jgi:ribonuclease D
MLDPKDHQQKVNTDVINHLLHVKTIVRQYDITEEDYLMFCNASYLSIDTETTGLNLSRDRLCLVQICDDKNVIFIHYPQSQYNSPNLVKLLQQKMEKIFHFSRFDLLALYKYLGVLCQNICCTRVLSKITRTYSDRHGLKHLLEEILQIKINKTQQLSYWGIEKLSDSQKHYAKADVIYLKALRDELASHAMREERWDLALKMFETLPTVVMFDNASFDVMSIINYI